MSTSLTSSALLWGSSDHLQLLQNTNTSLMKVAPCSLIVSWPQLRRVLNQICQHTAAFVQRIVRTPATSPCYVAWVLGRMFVTHYHSHRLKVV